MRRLRRSSLALCAVATLVLAGCSAAPSRPPDFVPSPTGGDVEGNDGVHIDPIVPTPSGGGTGGGSGASSAPGTAPSSSGQGKPSDPLVVATHLNAPVGLALLPDGTALVGERTTGRIVRVQPEAGQPVLTVRTLSGLDTAGDGGLLDLAVSPHYAEDNLIYAYVTTPKDNRVVDFTLHGPVTPVLTGIPRGRTGNVGRLAFAADGSLYVGTGDAGRPQLADDPHSLAGKILHVDDIGAPAAGNPQPSSPVYSTGHRPITGLCTVPSSTEVLDVESAPITGHGVINLVDSGANYGYPQASGQVTAPIGRLPQADTSPGGCAVLGSRIWTTSLNGQALLSATPRGPAGAAGLGSFTAVLAHRYGRLRTVVAAPDGALWLTTSNRDGHGHPVAADERVIRYVPSGGGGGANPA